MKNILSVLTLICLLFSLNQVQAQDAFGEIIKSGTTEAEKLATAYLNPLGRGFGVGLNNSWLTAGKPFKPGRFELRVFGTAAFVPDEDKSFDLSTLNLNSDVVKLANPNNKVAPTLFGQDIDGPQLDIYGLNKNTGKNEKIASFNSPAGIGIGIVPTPMYQLNVGFIKESEIMLRFFPETNQEDFSAQMYGIGLKHNVGRWLPVIRDLPISLIASAGYTHVRASYLSIDVEADAQYASAQQKSTGYYDDQQLDFNATGYSGSLVVNAGVKIISGFLGLNYSETSSNFNLVGKYPVTTIDENPPYQRYVKDLPDPLHVNMEQRQIGLTGGFRLKLAIFSLFAQGTYGRYSTATAGLGIGWN